MLEAEVEAEVKTETEVKFKEAEVAEQNNLLIDYRSQRLRGRDQNFDLEASLASRL